MPSPMMLKAADLCRDAEDAVTGRDNYDFHGEQPIYEASTHHILPLIKQ